MLLPALALQGRLDVAKRLAQEMWDDCPGIQELLETGQAKTDVAFSRTLAPFLGWVEPELPFRLLPLVAPGPEADHWQSGAAVWLSLANRDEADRLAKQYGVDWEDGVEELCDSNFPWLCRDRSLTDWLEWLANQTEPSPSKLRLLIAIARHQEAGPERLRSFERICDAWRKITVSDGHYMQAPNTRVLESLVGFDDLRVGEIEQLVFTALETSPVTYDSYHTLANLAYTARLLAVTSPEVSLQLIKNVLDDWHWMYFGKRLFTDSNPVIGAVVWAAPYAALEVVHDLEQRMADDMPVSRLQFRTALIEEINELLPARAQVDE
ncbi:MAG: hypothetical protein KatS3mg111_0450 [Pirellulaceae bacterium]|nr:MAG: hypothetical protein KatS3mg111_0450 [Pirellulaceae bacterium]